MLQGTKPEVRTYNTIISACNRSGQPESALRVYERMLADGAQPTAATYTALISAYGKTGKARFARLSPGSSRSPSICSGCATRTQEQFCARVGGSYRYSCCKHD